MTDASTVTLTAPNGMQVSVAADRQAALLSYGYRSLGETGGAADGPKSPPAKTKRRASQPSKQN